MLFSRRSSSKELVTLLTSRIIPVTSWRNKNRTVRSKVWSGHLSPLEPAGTRAGGVSPTLFGLYLLCGVTWTCSSVFTEDFPENLLQGLSRGRSDPRGTWCDSASPHPRRKSLWLCPFTPQTQEEWGPACLSINSCPVLSNGEEKKTLLSSVNWFFVTGYTSKTL